MSDKSVETFLLGENGLTADRVMARRDGKHIRTSFSINSLIKGDRLSASQVDQGRLGDGWLATMVDCGFI